MVLTIHIDICICIGCTATILTSSGKTTKSGNEVSQVSRLLYQYAKSSGTRIFHHHPTHQY